MINPRTGTISFDAPKVTITRQLTRARFLCSKLAKAVSDTLTGGAGYKTYWLAARFKSDGLTLAVTLCFQKDRLDNVGLVDDNPKFGTSWDDWSEAKELQKKASHDRWLRRCIGGQRRFRWGEIWSGYDERGGFSSILITYFKEPLKKERGSSAPAARSASVTHIAGLLRRVVQRAAEGNTDFCLLLESKNGRKRWLQLTLDTVNAAYPFDQAPVAKLRSLGIRLPRQLKLTEWEPGLFATFEYALDLGDPGERLDQIAEFVDAYFQNVLGASAAKKDLRVKEEQL